MRKRGELSRREFLVLTAGAAGSLVITACSPGGETTTTTLPSSTTAAIPGTTTTTAAPEPVISGYWDLLREVQRRVRTSPDHIPARLQTLAADGDIAGLVELLRGHVAVVPVNPAAWVSNTDGQRWGTRGTARSRMGTPREIAQLLSDTLNEAGIDATVVRVPDVGTVRDVLVNPQPLVFLPTEGPEDLLALGITADPEPPQADPALALEIADKALEAFDASIFRIDDPGELTATAQLPFVRVDTGSTPQIADLWTPVGGLLDVDDNRVNELGDIGRVDEAKFTLSVATDKEYRDPIEVATASFRLDHLAGRRVDVGFIPPATTLSELMMTRPADVTTVIPFIRVANPTMSDDEKEALFVDGTPFTIEGETFIDDGDRFQLGGGTVGGDGDPGTVAEVHINRVVATHYPKLTVEVELFDAAGNNVSDIAAGNFSISDNGFEVPFTLRRSKTPPPRIVFLVDNSKSVPEQFRDAGANRVVTTIATNIKERFPDARFRAAIVGASGASALGWKDDPAELDVTFFTSGSALWQSYADAAVLGGNIVVFLTDGVSGNIDREDEPEAPRQLVAALTSAPPAIMLGSGELGPAFQGIADITNGVALNIEDQDEAIAAVIEQLDRNVTSYDFLTLADPTATATSRTISVSVPAANLATEAGFQVPSPEESAPGPALTGIYLRIEANGVRVDRTLAGWPHRTQGELTPELVQEVRQALFGSYSVMTEAGAPSPAQILDDTIEAMLSWEPVLTLKDPDEIMAAAAAAHRIPHGAYTFSVPVTGEGPLTWETGLRMWLSTERTAPRGDVDVLRRSVDLLPVSRFTTATLDPTESVKLTAQRTAIFASIEEAVFDSSAARRLTGTLTSYDSLGDVPPEAREQYEALTNGWPRNFGFAANDDFDGAVAIDPSGGNIIAVLPDGTGGASSEAEINATFDRIISILELAAEAGKAVEAFANLEKAKAEKLRLATLAIFRMSAEGVCDLLKDEACGAAEGAIGGWVSGGVGAYGGVAGGIAVGVSESIDNARRWGTAAGLGGALPPGFSVCP